MSAFTGLGRATSVLLAAMAAGCIENPGPDPQLLLPKPERSEISYYFPEMYGYFLFHFERLDGITRVAIENRTGAPLDSGVAWVRIWGRTAAGSFLHLFPGARCERMVGFSGLEAGERLDLGVVDSLSGISLDTADIEAVLLHANLRGRVGPHPYSGRYAGTWSALDSAGMEHRGKVEGLMEADGEFRIGLFDTLPGPPRASLQGYAQSDGTRQQARGIALVRHEAYREDAADGGFSQKDGRIRGNFGFQERGWLDTLDLDLLKLPFP